MSKLAVISDIHDNLPNLKKALDLIKKEKIDYLICTGDVQSLEGWQILNNLELPTWAVLGNADHEHFDFTQLQEKITNIKLFANVGVADIENKKIIFAHYPNTLKTALEKSKTKYDLALHGHTHQPWEESWQETKILNPGNIANIHYAPTFAIINLGSLEATLILLNEI